MKGIIDFFASNPEAVATLLVCAIGGVLSIIAMLYSTFASHPIIVRNLGNRSLVFVDPALRENVHVKFTRGEEVDIKELRQIDLEIFNSHPRQVARDCAITVNLPSPNATILGVTAANNDNRSPDLGGRRITSKVLGVPVQPVDPILSSIINQTFPAIVVQIPYLERIVKNDRVFLRITYDGPTLTPTVQGAKSSSSSAYQKRQTHTIFFVLIAAGLLSLMLNAESYKREGIPILTPQLIRNPFFLASIGLLTVSVVGVLVAISRFEWTRKWLRPIHSLLVPPPFSSDSLAQFHFFNTAEHLQSQGDNDAELAILSAKYGEGDMLKDVTEILRSSVSEGRLEIQATNDALGGDPVPHRVKSLKVIYSHKGQQHTKEIPETGWLHLP